MPFVVRVTSAHEEHRDELAFSEAMHILRYKLNLSATSAEAEQEWQTAWLTTVKSQFFFLSETVSEYVYCTQLVLG